MNTFKDASKHLESTDIKLYRLTPETENILIRFWIDLVRSGDLPTLFHEPPQTFVDFARCIEPPAMLLYTTGPDGSINAAFNLAPCFRGVSLGVWVNKETRGKKRGYEATIAVIKFALNLWPVIVSFANDSAVIDIHERMGYKRAEHIPGLLDFGYTMTYLTMDAFNKRRKI